MPVKAESLGKMLHLTLLKNVKEVPPKCIREMVNIRLAEQDKRVSIKYFFTGRKRKKKEGQGEEG